MKRAWIIVLALVLCLSLCACGREAKEYTFPEGTAVLGVDVAGMAKEEAWSKLASAAADYALELTVDGMTIPVTSRDIDLTCSQDAFLAGADALEAGTSADFSGIISFNEDKLKDLMSQNFNKDVTEASITFDESQGLYVLVPHTEGLKSDPGVLAAAVKNAICTLAPQRTLNGVTEVLQPVLSADAPELLEALELANKMIGIKLAYTFAPDGEETTLEIPAETIRSFVSLGEDGLTPVINQGALDAYVVELSEQYSTEGTTGSFQTTGGSSVNLTVSYNGTYVDTEALTQDILTCMQEGISETRTAPYLDSGVQDMAYGGTYIEVNLTSQHLWFYKDGECIVSTSMVSGKVAEDMCTPNGVYSIYSMSTDTYLVGEDYRTFVNYWMPFHYGYGLHDATWRGSFGGDIYLYNGSHGCVNLPLKAAAAIYKNATVGTKVILYGGKRSVPPVTQFLSGATSYDVADDNGTFKLNIKPKYSNSKGPEFSYVSDNPSVATVTEDGTVTIKGVGKAKITVTAAKFSYYTEAQTTVTVNVHSACDEGRHIMGTPTTVTAPTCQPGLETIRCTKCDHSKEQEIAPVQDHTYGDWVITKEPTCGAEGTKERTCTVCNTQKETGTVAATEQHTESDWITTKEPTCVSDGAKQTKCTVCGISMNAGKVPATGVHAPGQWETVKEATCTADGIKSKYCIHCSAEVDTASIAAGHKAGKRETTDATCTTDGQAVTKCAVCGEVLETVVIPAKGHNFNDDGSCTVCGQTSA